jgi:hypothetical protein
MITKDSSMRCDVLILWDAIIFCNNFARLLQKIAKLLQKIVACYVLILWDATIFFNNFMLPKRRFWKPENHFGPPVWALFQGCEYSFWATLT